jgi:hypothetical protein
MGTLDTGDSEYTAALIAANKTFERPLTLRMLQIVNSYAPYNGSLYRILKQTTGEMMKIAQGRNDKEAAELAVEMATELSFMKSKEQLERNGADVELLFIRARAIEALVRAASASVPVATVQSTAAPSGRVAS